MKEERHVIWSNYGLDYEDWRDDLEAEYPDLSEDERISLMYEINGDYLDDERANLNVQLSQPILVVGKLSVFFGFTNTHIDYDLVEFWHFHNIFVSKFFGHGIHDLIFVHFF